MKKLTEVLHVVILASMNVLNKKTPIITRADDLTDSMIGILES